MSISVAKIYGFSVYTINELKEIYFSLKHKGMLLDEWIICNFTLLDHKYIRNCDYDMLEQYLELA